MVLMSLSQFLGHVLHLYYLFHSCKLGFSDAEGRREVLLLVAEQLHCGEWKERFKEFRAVEDLTVIFENVKLLLC